jgi:hypothetical protein
VIGMLRRCWRALIADGPVIQKGGVAYNPFVPVYLAGPPDAPTMAIWCARCHHLVEGARAPGVTMGFYEVTKPPWSKYRRDGESVVCDDCMHVDPGYRRDYGAVSILDTVTRGVPVERLERAYQAFARQRYASTGVCGPHCDDQVLHAPGECEYCDGYAELQAARERIGVNFTGHGDASKRPCFAERRRPVETIHRWGGSAPQPNETVVP